MEPHPLKLVPNGCHPSQWPMRAKFNGGTSCHFHRMVESFKASRACDNLQIINSLRGGSQMIHRNYGTTMNADSWKWPNLARVPKTIEDLSTVDYPKTLALVANFPLYQASVLFRSNERAFFCTLVQF